MTLNNQFFEDLHICDISVVSGVRAFGRTVDHSRRGRAGNGILYVWRGEATFFCNRETTVVKDGEIVFIPKNIKYELKYTAKTTTFVVVNFDAFGKMGEEITLFDGIRVLAKDDELLRFAKIMSSFEVCGPTKTLGAAFRKKELIYRLLGAIYSSNSYLSTRTEIATQIAEGVRLLEQTYLENLPIARFATASHVSENTFRTLFQKEIGTSPIKYRNRLRIERAKELLSEDGFTVAEVAYASGFENVGYFCRYYRQIMGESPSETKKRTLSDIR